MTELDPTTRAALAQLRSEWSPPSGIEARMLADFHARLPDPGGGGGESGDLPTPELGSLTTNVAGGVTSSVAWVHAVKVVAAVLGLTGAGLGGVVVVAKLARGPERAVVSTPAPIETRTRAGEVPTSVTERAPEPERLEPLVPERALDDPTPTRPSRMGKSLASAPSTPTVDLTAELALLRPARSAKPIDALELLDRHADEFPNGALASEREALRAATLCTLGRLEQAEAAVDRLLELAPGPLLRERVRSACDGKLALPTTGLGSGGDGSR